MNRKVLILENDVKLNKSNHHYIFKFLESYTGEIIDFSNLHTKTDMQVWSALNDCTDIAVQTCFINGSDYQFYQFLSLLSKIKESKNIHIALLGSSLTDWFDKLEVKDLMKINHHKIFSLDYDGTLTHISFAYKILPYLRSEVLKRTYHRTAINRPTNIKVKILACNGCGEIFKTLPIGEIVDTLDMSLYDENVNRGVWVWGNNVPVKLINDCGLQEYAIISKLSTDEQIEEIYKLVGLKFTDIERLKLLAFTQIIEDDEYSNMDKANILCEEMEIEKRGNRQRIYTFLNTQINLVDK